MYIHDLKAVDPPTTINEIINKTHYIGFEGLTFNNFSMTFPDVPFLFQSPPNQTDRCDIDTNPSDGQKSCEHVIHEPYKKKYTNLTKHELWLEVILINDNRTAHPIHQHGGWYRVVGMGQYDYSIDRASIMAMDKNCTDGKHCLPRNFNHPPSKDTIQVPTNGYVIYRTFVDNPGCWIVHCHINAHVIEGMAMVYQVGELGGESGQDWPLGPFRDNVNKKCLIPPTSTPPRK